MSRRGPTGKRAALPTTWWGGEPPIPKADAEAILGTPVGEDAWGQVHDAYEKLAERLAMLTMPRANNNPKDPQSYENRRARTEKTLSDALQAVSALRRDHDFVSALTENAEFSHMRQRCFKGFANPDQYKAYRNFFNLYGHLDAAASALLDAHTIVARAEPREIEVMSEGQAKSELVCRIRAILEAAGLPAAISTGRELEELHDEYTGEQATVDDLKPFERLIWALRIHDPVSTEANKPTAFSAWLRRACKKTSPRT